MKNTLFKNICICHDSRSQTILCNICIENSTGINLLKYIFSYRNFHEEFNFFIKNDRSLILNTLFVDHNELGRDIVQKYGEIPNSAQMWTETYSSDFKKSSKYTKGHQRSPKVTTGRKKSPKLTKGH